MTNKEEVLREFGEWIKTQPIYAVGGKTDKEIAVIRNNGKFENAIEVYLKEKEQEERIKEVLDVVHKTIYGFMDLRYEEEPMSDKDKLLLEVNKAICNNLKQLQQDECIKMTDTDCLDEDARQASIPYTYNAPQHDWKCGYPDSTKYSGYDVNYLHQDSITTSDTQL